MDPVTLLIAAPAAAALVGGALYAGHRYRKARESLWSAIADERGGTFHEAKLGFWKSTSAAIEVPVEHARVYLDTYVVRTGRSSTTYTRARARFAVPDAPTFEVRPEGVLATVGKLIGLQDVELGGDPLFDEEYTVKCVHPDAVREVWTPDAKRIHLQRIPAARVESDGSVITAHVLGALRDVAKIEGLLDLVGTLASHGARELEAYATHPDARFTPPTGSWLVRTRPRLAITTDKATVDAAVRTTPDGLRLLLACRIARADVEPFDGELPSGAGLPRGLIGDELRADLDAVGACRIEADDDRVLLTWRGLPDDEAFASGVAIVVAIAAGSGRLGAFR